MRYRYKNKKELSKSLKNIRRKKIVLKRRSFTGQKQKGLYTVIGKI